MEKLFLYHERVDQLVEGVHSGTYVVERDVAGVGIVKGDVIVQLARWWPTPEVHGDPRWLSKDEFAALRAATFGSYRESFTPSNPLDSAGRFGLRFPEILDHVPEMQPGNQWKYESLYGLMVDPDEWDAAGLPQPHVGVVRLKAIGGASLSDPAGVSRRERDAARLAAHTRAILDCMQSQARAMRGMDLIEAMEACKDFGMMVHSPASHPVEARSDAGAIFELIRSCGGKMPGEVGP